MKLDPGVGQVTGRGTARRGTGGGEGVVGSKLRLEQGEGGEAGCAGCEIWGGWRAEPRVQSKCCEGLSWLALGQREKKRIKGDEPWTWVDVNKRPAR